MLPAHEGFRADDRPRRKHDLGLEVEDELAVVHGAPQARFEGEALADRRVQGRRAELEVVPAALLGAVEGDVRVAQERVGIRAVIREEADSDARRHGQPLGVGHERCGDRVEHLAGEGRDVLLLDVREEEDELVAADARDGVAGPDAAAQARSDLPEDLVADAMAHRVVHGLEAVEVEEEDGELRAGPLRLGQREVQVVLEALAVREARERVVVREVLDLLLGPLSVRDVDARPLDHGGKARLLHDRAALERPHERAVPAPRMALPVHERALVEEPADPVLAVGVHGVELLGRRVEDVHRRRVPEHAREALVALEHPAVEGGPVEPGRVALVEPAEPPFGRAQAVLRAGARRRVAEAPDAADGLAVEALREGVALEDPPVAEAQDVEALATGVVVQLADLPDEGVGVRELGEHVADEALVVARREDLVRDRPELGKAAVVRDDAAARVDDEDAVGGRFERGLEQGKGAPHRGVRVLAREGRRDVLRDVRQEARLALAEADRAAVALDDERPEDPSAGLERDADPVERRRADLLDLAAVHELREEPGGREQGPARADDVLRQAAAERLRRGRRVELVDEVGKPQELLLGVPERDVEVAGVDEVSDEPVDRRVELAEVPGLLRGFRDTRPGLLDGGRPLALESAPEDLREERQGANRVFAPVRLPADRHETHDSEKLQRRADGEEDDRTHAHGVADGPLPRGLRRQVRDPRDVEDRVPPHFLDGPAQVGEQHGLEHRGVDAPRAPAREGREACAVLRDEPDRGRVRSEKPPELREHAPDLFVDLSSRRAHERVGRLENEVRESGPVLERGLGGREPGRRSERGGGSAPPPSGAGRALLRHGRIMGPEAAGALG